MACLRNLVFVILCITCLNLFTDGRLFYHIESFFSPNYVYLDNDNIDDLADPTESHEDSFVMHITTYDNDRKLYISLIPVSDDSGDDDCDNPYIGFIYGITMFAYNGAPDKWCAVFCTRI